MRPLAATPRNPDRPTDGALVAVVAEALGTPLMPWQRQVADVAGERLPNGAYAYPIVVVSVPRQSGKTTLMRARLVARCLTQPGVQVFYTAQTGKDARERWRDLTKQIMASPMRNRVAIKQAAGAERVVFGNGSELRVFAPVGTALHGYTPPEVHLDEAWAHDGVRGEELMGAIVPAQITIPDRQLWIVSTAGTSESAFFRRWYDAAVDGTDGVAGFVWAAPPGADAYSPETWKQFHPALGQTISTEDLAAAASAHSRAEFERAYCNRWTRTSASVIPADVWAALADDLAPPTEAVALAYDVAHDRGSADVVAAWPDGDGYAIKLVQSGPGYGWVGADVGELADQLGAPIGADGHGPANSVTEKLAERARVLTAAEYASACGEFLELVNTGRLRHDGSPRLAEAAQNVMWRPMQADLWGWSRRTSAGPVSALVAATVAVWLARHRPAPAQKPFIVSGAA